MPPAWLETLMEGQCLQQLSEDVQGPPEVAPGVSWGSVGGEVEGA